MKMTAIRLMVHFVLTYFVFFSNVASAQDTTGGIAWYPPIQLSTDRGGLPEVAVTGDTVHVIWRGNQALRLPYRRSTNNGFSFDHARELLVDSATFWVEPNVAKFLVTDTALFVFHAGAQSGIGNSPVYFIASTDNGGTWHQPVKASNDTSSFIASPSGWGETLAMMYDKKSTNTLIGILGSTNGGASWAPTFDEQWDYSTTRCAVSAFPQSQFALLHLANVVLLGPPAIQHKRSSDLGTTWMDSTIISSANGNASIEPDIAAGIDEAGRVRVLAAWRDNKYGCQGFAGCSIICRQSLDGAESFSDERVLTEIPTGYKTDIALSGENIAIAWDAEQPSSLPHVNVRISRNGGDTWCPVVDVTPTGFNAGRTRVAISRTSAHLVWTQNDSAGAIFHVYYRRGVFVTTGVKETKALPEQRLLSQNFPNPFNPSTKIVYRVQSREFVSLKIYDMLGREVATLVNEKADIGEYTIEWKTEGIPSGVYYYRLTAGNHMETRKAVLIR